MKTTFKILATLGLVLLGQMPLQAQNKTQQKMNYVVLSKNMQQLNPILITADALAEADGMKYGKMEVVICGKTVQDIKDSPELSKLISEAQDLHVKINVCGLSLKKFGVDPNSLPSGLNVVDNGIFYSFQLQKKGYMSLTI
ncbi:DsrE family protein [Gaetbulibacter aestuarii]|uniref:DsrE family protein n=1 Tax=Gaetbulibacter aestuarii TaxID=1502358 RepID=A0ABW7MX50_9FLAO